MNTTPTSPTNGERSAMGRPDPLNTEFTYYSSALKALAPALSGEVDRKFIIPWIQKLFRPEYHSSKFREKRNRYLLCMAISLMNDEAFGVFRTSPPIGALAEMRDIVEDPIPAAEWELDNTWKDTLAGLPQEFQLMSCCVHRTMEECNADHQLDQILDQEFQFLLYLARPYAALLNLSDERTRVATWLQTLCTIHSDSCSSMRGIRNDYIMALLGYLQTLRVIGPFSEYPPFKTLPPLAETAKQAANDRPLTDPTGPEANEFLACQPIPDEGAFCYIAVTGDLETDTIELKF